MAAHDMDSRELEDAYWEDTHPLVPGWIVENLADFYDVGLSAIHHVAVSSDGYRVRSEAGE